MNAMRRLVLVLACCLATAAHAAEGVGAAARASSRSTAGQVASKAEGRAARASKRSTAKKAEKKEPRPPPREVFASAALPVLVRDKIAAALNAEDLDGADVGFIVTDVETGAVLAESGADLLINPASNDKMITSAAALSTLKPEYRFKTEYFVQGSLKEGRLNGNLIVKGYGDPSIVSERLVRVANELYLFGVEEITGDVIVDDSWFDGNEEARGWEQEDAPDRAYAAPVSALMVNYNAVAVYVRPGARPGDPAIVRVDPPSARVTLRGEVITAAVGSDVRLSSSKDRDDGAPRDAPGKGTLLTIDGSIGLRDSPERIYRRVYDPALHFGSTLTTFLQQRGVVMKHSVTRGTVPAGARLLLVDKSPALKDIVATLNHHSNNVIAEALVKAMGAEVFGAPGTFEHGLAVGRQYLEQKVGLAPGSYVYENGSGLNDVNRFTARQLAQLVCAVSADYEIATEWFTSLAVAGTAGTISHRMKDTPAMRHLRAKTGTLRGVSALSGTVVQPSGNVLAFSILTQGYKKGAPTVWKVQTQIGAALASDGTWEPDATEDEDSAVATLSPSAAPPPIEMTAHGG